MSTIRGGRGGAARGRGASPFGAQTGVKTARPFTPRGGRGNNQVRFNGQTRGASAAAGAAGAERGGRGGVRGSYRGRAKATTFTTTRPSSPAPAPAPSPPAQSLNGSLSYPDRFQALKKQRDQERTQAIAQGFLADPDKPRTLAEAITPVGTCPDMCPEFERVERVVQKDVWGPEQDDDGNPAEHRMVKKFRRAAAGLDEQLPSDLRPPLALKRTVDYLFNDIVANAESLGSVHHFVWDRTRAVRNDFSIQQITKPADVQVAIDCYERIARFHILSLHQLALPEKPYDKYDWYQEREQLDRTLLSLMQYYDDSRGRLQCPNEAEFRAYLIIFQAQDPTPDLEERVNNWPLFIRSHGRIRIALELNSATSNVVDPQGPLKPRALYPVAREDWNRFFDLVRSSKVSYLMACVAEIYFKLVRRTALNAIWRGFKGQLPDFTLSLMTDLLGFDNTEQTEKFCQHYGFVFKPSDSGETCLDLNSVQGKNFPQEAAGLEHQSLSESLVESKRMGRTLPAVINGYTVAAAQDSGLIEESYVDDSQMEDSQAEDDEDSLFVPQEGPKSLFGTTKDQASASSPFAAFQPRTESAPTSVFTQSKPSTSTFGQPSSNSATQGGFGFGKPSAPPPEQSVATPMAPSSIFAMPTTNTAPSMFAKPASNPEETANAKNPFSSPFSFAKPATTLTDSSVSKPTISPGSEPQSPFSFPKIPTASDEVRSSSNAVGTGGFGAPSAPTSSNLSTSPFNQTAAGFDATASPAPSLFAPSTSQAPQPKPSFTFPSTQQASSQAAGSAPDLGKSLFSSPAKESQKTIAPQQQESQSLSQPQLSIFNKPPHIPAAPPSFSLTPPTPHSIGDSPSPVPANAPVVDSQPGSFSFAQPNQPRKPSPLSKSFALPGGSEQAKPKPAEVQQVTQQPSQVSLNKDFATQGTSTSPASAFEIATAKPSTPTKSKNEILDHLAQEIVLDTNNGLLRQFVEYHARQTVMGVYDELYMESIQELADAFRKETLSYRYGKRWREICWRRRLARQGRERRKRAKKDQSVRELKRKLAAEKDAVDEFLKSAGQAKNLSSSSNGSRNGQGDGVSFSQGTLPNPADAFQNLQSGPMNYPHGHKRRKGASGSDHATEAGEKHEQSTASPRSHFLGFSMRGSKSRLAITSTPSRSNYFRLKALGINPGSDTPTAMSTKKRSREESEDASIEASPPAKRSHTPPLGAIEAPKSNLHSPTTVLGSTSITNLASSLDRKPLSKARQEDEELFARARAARQALADSAAWYRSETQKEEAHRNEAMIHSLNSPSMQRAREAARLRMSQTANHTSSNLSPIPRIPAYRMRESRFVPRENYDKAIEKAQRNIEARTGTSSRATPRDIGASAVSFSSPTFSTSRLSQETPRGQTSSKSYLSRTQDIEDSLAQSSAIHTAPGDPAWTYDPSLFAASIDPALSNGDTNGYVESSITGSLLRTTSVETGQPRKTCTEFEVLDDDDDDRPEDVQQGDGGYEADSMVNSGVYDDDESDEEEESSEEDDGLVATDFERSAHNSEDFVDEEDYDDEEEVSDDYDEESEDDQMEFPGSTPNNANSVIKAGTGTAEDAFELSD